MRQSGERGTGEEGQGPGRGWPAFWTPALSPDDGEDLHTRKAKEKRTGHPSQGGPLSGLSH